MRNRRRRYDAALASTGFYRPARVYAHASFTAPAASPSLRHFVRRHVARYAIGENSAPAAYRCGEGLRLSRLMIGISHSAADGARHYFRSRADISLKRRELSPFTGARQPRRRAALGAYASPISRGAGLISDI